MFLKLSNYFGHACIKKWDKLRFSLILLGEGLPPLSTHPSRKIPGIKSTTPFVYVN